MQTLYFCLSLGFLSSLGWSSTVPEIQNATEHYVAIEDCGVSVMVVDNSPDRIIGGRYAEYGEFPWMVSLRERDDPYGFDHVCGAAILNDRWIITAAHCFESKSTSMYEVVVGLHQLSRLRRGKAKIHKLSKIIMHTGYDAKTNLHDIALVKTSRRIDIEGSDGFVTGVCLPKRGSDPRGYATVSGWGHTKEDGENSNTLKTVDVPIIPREICNERYDEDPYDDVDEIVETMICAGSKGRDSCQSDSGGPLIQYIRGRATLIGVVSYGIGCGMKYYPGVYTRVSSYIDWIERNAV